MNEIFLEITMVVALAAVLGLVAKWLRQPTILGYIATGIVIGPLGLLRLDNGEVLDALAQIGITLLLFLVGIEMRFKELKELGKPALMTGIGQILFTSLFGFLICLGLGFKSLPALYIAVALTFSSTIIVVKLLSEKKVLDSLYGKLVVGFLLVQDFVALIALILITSLSQGGADTGMHPAAAIGVTLAKSVMLFGGAILLGKHVVPFALRAVSRSQEMLFLTSLAWGLGLAALVSMPPIGFSIEIGGFLAGLSLASSIEHFQISGRIKSLRDFFIVMFFIVLGSKLALSNLAAVWQPALLLSLFVLIGNPLIVMAILGGLGYRSRTAFLSSVTVAQISEFSLILVALGHRVGHLDELAVSLVTAVGIVTITASSYLIIYGESIYERLRPLLKIFEFRGKNLGDEAVDSGAAGHAVLIGCHRMGGSILHSLQRRRKHFLVVDFNPDVVKKLSAKGIHAMYGDISDPEIQEAAGLSKARLVVSTVPTYEDSLALLAYMRANNRRAQVILAAETEEEARHLYRAGAHYVLLPHFIGGLQVAEAIKKDTSPALLKQMRRNDLAMLAMK